MMLEPGQTIERFTVEAKLGEGGMAAVYRVRHNTLGSYHALKLLKVANDEIRRRLVEEGRVQASLHHPNVVAVTDVLVVAGQPGLLMELVDGPTLEEWLWENRPTLPQAEALFRGVLAGVGRAHRAGLVHRDLKPGNILLDFTDGALVPKVTDFGLAKILSDDDSHSQTRSGVTLGTPQFMAPEQIRNAKNVDQRADIFALGCILYNLVCGRPPFQDPDILNLYNAIASGSYPPPETFAPDLPVRVSAAIQACLTVDRDARAQDCERVRITLFGDQESAADSSAKLWAGAIAESKVRRVSAVLKPGTGSIAKASSTMAYAPAAPPPKAQTVTGEKVILPLAALSLGAGFVGFIALIGVLWWSQSGQQEEATPAAPDEVAEVEPVAAEPVAAEPVVEAVVVPVAEPVAEPEPVAVKAVKPKTVAAMEPVQAEPVAPRSGKTGQVSVTGKVDAFWLQIGKKKFQPGTLSPGNYALWVQFPGREAQSVGNLSLKQGQSVTVACDPGFAMCKF